MSEVKQFTKIMESLAHEIQVKLEAGDNIMLLASELARNTMIFTFFLGEMYAMKHGDTSCKAKSRVVNTTLRNYYNVRDSLGRFTRKVPDATPIS
jgi:hypothetical protein